MALWSVVSLLPDVDVIGFALGVDYADPWGHRGATHSFTASIVVGLAIGLAAPLFRLPRVRTALIASAVLASHALFDTMTDGGLGCALLWPFDLTRYFAPWRPIPVAPIGLDFLSREGLIVALIELILFSPVVVFALRSRGVESQDVATVESAGRPRTGVSGRLTTAMTILLALWFAAVWFISSGDQVRDAIVGVFLREDTAYSTGFTEAAFRSIKPAQSEQDVRHLVGVPFREAWFYVRPGTLIETASADDQKGCWEVRSEAGVVVTVRNLDECRNLGIAKGLSLAQVERLLGAPSEACWQYSWSPGEKHYRARVVCLSQARVVAVFRQWH